MRDEENVRGEEDFDEDIEDVLRREDEALVLLDRLRIREPTAAAPAVPMGGGRREGRRWPTPDGVTVELHDGEHWQPLPVSDLGIGGLRVTGLPAWLAGPAPARLRGVTGETVLALADLMWQDRQTGAAGLRFQFQDPEERDQWTGILIDALLARYALG